MPGFLFMSVLYNILRSRRLTIILLLSLIPLIIMEAQRRDISGYVFLGFSIPLAANLAFCLVDHMRKTGRLTLKRAGFLIFHASFLVIMAGGIITYRTYAVGYIELAEGQGFLDSKENYTAWRQRFGTREGTGIHVTLERTVLEFWENGQIREFWNEIRIRDGEKETAAVVRVNGSVKYGGLLINMARFYGLAPYFTLITPHGNTSGFVNIREETKTNSFSIPHLGYSASVSYGSIGDDVVTIRVVDDRSKVIEATLKKGEVIELGPSRLELTDVRIWNGLTVVTDSGRGITYSGFALFLIGLVLYYVKRLSEVRLDDKP